MVGPSRKVLWFSLVCTVISGCAPMSIYYKQGVSVNRMNSESLACATFALKQAPVANQLRQRPPIYYPGRQYCNSAGQCSYSPGYWIDGGFYTVDVNQPLRTRVEVNCMAQKGYQPVSLPRCQSTVSQSVTHQATTTLPPISENSCVIPFKDGSYQIVTPGGLDGG